MVLGDGTAQENVHGHIGGVGAKLGVVHAAGGEGTGSNKGVGTGVVGNAGIGENLCHGAGGGHDHVIGGGEDGLDPAHHGAGGGEDFVGGVAGLFQVRDALAV